MPARRASYADVEDFQMASVSTSPGQSLKNRLSRELFQRPGTLLGLQISDMMSVLRHDIPKHSTDDDLIRQAQTLQDRLAERMNTSTHWSSTDMEEAVFVMNFLIDCAPDLPPTRVGYVHTMIGLLRYEQREYEGALESFHKALWIKNSCRESPEEIGIAMHRLGMAYHKSGDQKEACSLLQKAMVSYCRANMSKMHPYYVSAKETLERCSSKPRHTTTQTMPSLVSSQKAWKSLSDLPILEDPTES